MKHGGATTLVLDRDKQEEETRSCNSRRADAFLAGGQIW